MENSSLDEIVVLRVKNICCTAYQKKLKKELSKISGVYAIAINPEKSLVSVRGQVDANLVLNTITKTGKQAKIICNNTNESSSRHQHQRAYGSGRNDYYQPRNPSPKKYRNRKDEWEEEHVCEDYIPPPIDPRICRDFYCTSHNMRPTFFDSHVPFGSHPYRAYNQPLPPYGYGGVRFDPRAFGYPPPPPPPMYGYPRSYGSYGYGRGRGLPFM